MLRSLLHLCMCAVYMLRQKFFLHENIEAEIETQKHGNNSFRNLMNCTEEQVYEGNTGRENLLRCLVYVTAIVENAFCGIGFLLTLYVKDCLQKTKKTKKTASRDLFPTLSDRDFIILFTWHSWFPSIRFTQKPSHGIPDVHAKGSVSFHHFAFIVFLPLFFFILVHAARQAVSVRQEFIQTSWNMVKCELPVCVQKTQIQENTK